MKEIITEKIESINREFYDNEKMFKFNMKSNVIMAIITITTMFFVLHSYKNRILNAGDIVSLSALTTVTLKVLYDLLNEPGKHNIKQCELKLEKVFLLAILNKYNEK